MRLGLYFDLRNPAQWRQDPARTYAFTLEMCEEAERLGAESVWFTEHHLFDDDYLAAPLTMAAAAAARTTRVRIGTAVVIAPLHHPVEIAEQAAAVDLISSGRLDLGLGTGYRAPEFELYGQSLEKRYGRTDETARRLRELWTQVTPRPVQDPLPIWMGYQGPQGARRAGRLGAGLLSAQAGLWAPYREGLLDAGHDPAQARMAGGLQAWVSADPERDWPTVSTHLRHQLDSYRRNMVAGTDAPPPKPIDPDRLRALGAREVLKGFLYGTPEQLVPQLRDYVGDAPVETLFFWASIGGMPEDVVAANVRLLCTRLRPLIEAL